MSQQPIFSMSTTMYKRWVRSFLRMLSWTTAAGLVHLSLLTSGQAESLASVGQGVCARTSGLQGLIKDIDADDSTLQPTVYVERGALSRPVKVGCFLQAGDTVRPAPGTTAVIMLPDRVIVTIDFDHPLRVPEVRPPGFYDRMISIIEQAIGTDITTAEKTASIGTIGAVRSAGLGRPSLIMPGMIGVGPQYVDARRPLYLRWVGGAPPFKVSFLPVHENANSQIQLPETAARSANLDLSNLKTGAYTLTIAGADKTPFALRVNLVAPTDVPAPPAIGTADNQETRDLVEAVWLLTRAESRWRLDALSRIEVLATEHGNIVAHAILYSSTGANLAKASAQ